VSYGLSLYLNSDRMLVVGVRILKNKHSLYGFILPLFFARTADGLKRILVM
jgi:hypothetical protein